MSNEPTFPSVLRIASMLDVGRLSADILRLTRTHAVVCASIASWGSKPQIDVEALASELGPAEPSTSCRPATTRGT
jgi:hypothetical protein